jgi:hypothetical protein
MWDPCQTRQIHKVADLIAPRREIELIESLIASSYHPGPLTGQADSGVCGTARVGKSWPEPMGTDFNNYSMVVIALMPGSEEICKQSNC